MIAIIILTDFDIESLDIAKFSCSTSTSLTVSSTWIFYSD